jgi:hypothetical protein
MFLTVPEREHVRTLVVAQLRAEGHLGESQQEPALAQPLRSQQAQNLNPRAGGQQTFENEDLSKHYTTGQDDIPF